MNGRQAEDLISQKMFEEGPGTGSLTSLSDEPPDNLRFNLGS